MMVHTHTNISHTFSESVEEMQTGLWVITSPMGVVRGSFRTATTLATL